LVERQVEVLERELATDLHERTRDGDPAAVEPRVERDERTVTRRVEDADELLTHEDRVREDDAAPEHRGEGLGDRGLPGAGRPEGRRGSGHERDARTPRASPERRRRSRSLRTPREPAPGPSSR